MARSINQNAYTGGLPNFRNLGVLLRIGVLVNLFALAAAIVKSNDTALLWQQVVQVSALVQPLLFLSLLALASILLGQLWLARAAEPVNDWKPCPSNQAGKHEGNFSPSASHAAHPPAMKSLVEISEKCLLTSVLCNFALCTDHLSLCTL